ncbi:MAG: histidine phosphatase family protein [Herminiimonas sp.]|jgi:probable phosphoglycerate mutase|nr:histidine phosphatase family protein [Herminiimonas sp.]
MTEIILVRHGETDWNVEKRLQGHLDIALNAEGERQAAALGQALSAEPVDAIFASDLQRAMQTAQAIAAPRAMAIHIEPALRERCYGAFEGLLYGDIGKRYPDAYAAWRAHDVDARFPAGRHQAETLREFFERAMGVITRLANAYGNRKIVVVTHGGVLECVYRAAKAIGFLPARDFDIFNASINRIVWNGAAMQILQWGDIAHLKHEVLDEIEK